MRGLVLAAALAVGACGAPPSPAPAPAATPAATATPAADLRGTCCAECTEAASQDPSAMSLDLVPCVDYARHIVNGAAALSSECAGWFSEHPAMVQDCR